MEIESLEIRNAIAKIEYDITNMWKQIYPVGSIYLTISQATPEDWFGGTWERVGIGQYLLGVDPSDETGHWDASDRTGGSLEKTLIDKNVPAHTHQICAHTDVGYTANGGHDYPMLADANFLNQSLLISYSGEQNPEPFDITPPFISVYMWKRTS